MKILQIMLQDSRVFEMMTLAQDMGVEELRAACEDHVISTLSVDNACTFLTSVMEIHEKAGMICWYIKLWAQKQKALVYKLHLFVKIISRLAL